MTYYEGQPLCETCYHDDELVSTVFFRNDKNPYQISSARNSTRGNFKAKWEAIDGWRGRYELESASYSRVFTDAILPGHESENMLMKLNDKAMDVFDAMGIDYARSFNRTSNLFSTVYDIWVKKDPLQILEAHLVLEKIKQDVDYNNELYSTGILIERETLEKLRGIFHNKYEIRTEMDLLNLFKEKGEPFIDEIRDGLKSSSEEASGDD